MSSNEPERREPACGLRVRLAARADAPALVRFNQAMASETEGKALDPAVLEPGVEALFDDPGRGFYVVAADAHGEVVGGLLVTFEWSDWRNGTFWWIQSVYVAPAHRRRGVYSALYAFVTERARRTGGVYGFRLYVERDNRRAQSTYERLGMEPTAYLVYEQALDSESTP